MLCCASCGKNQDLRLYEVRSGDRVKRRWWCPECRFSARRLGVNAELAPAWIERAALHQLPMKPLESARPGGEIAGPNLSRLALRIASQHLQALSAQSEPLARRDDELPVEKSLRAVAADVTG
jgi:hypothetical protein